MLSSHLGLLYVIAYLNRGNFYYDTGTYDRAIQDYNQAIDRNPKNVATTKEVSMIKQSKTTTRPLGSVPTMRLPL